MSSDHTASTFPVSGRLESNEFREFRRSPTFAKEMKMCFGCWVPGNVGEARLAGGFGDDFLAFNMCIVVLVNEYGQSID
jgi:hypothetical protein